MSNIATCIMSAMGATHLLSTTFQRKRPTHTKKGPGRRPALSRLEAAFNVVQREERRVYGGPSWLYRYAFAGYHTTLVKAGYTMDGLRAEFVRLSAKASA